MLDVQPAIVSSLQWISLFRIFISLQWCLHCSLCRARSFRIMYATVHRHRKRCLLLQCGWVSFFCQISTPLDFDYNTPLLVGLVHTCAYMHAYLFSSTHNSHNLFLLFTHVNTALINYISNLYTLYTDFCDMHVNAKHYSS